MVRTQLAPSLPHVLGDRVQLQQVLLNLLLNAGEAMGGNGKDNRRVTVSATANAQGFVIIKIADNGPGLDAAISEHLFEPFVTTKESGLGLGLSICQSIMATHNGQISATKNPDGGATFTVTLPHALRPASVQTSRARSGAA